MADVPDDKSMRKLKEGGYSAERKIMPNFGKLKRRIRELAEWYGMAYREERPYSTIYPVAAPRWKRIRTDASSANAASPPTETKCRSI